MQQAERQRLIDRAKASISTNDIVVEQLSTHQGRLGQSDFTKRDHSINGCAIICLLVISLYFCGLSGREFIIGVAHIIDSLCQPILQLIRLGLETSSYEFVTFQVAFEAMQALGLLPGGCILDILDVHYGSLLDEADVIALFELLATKQSSSFRVAASLYFHEHYLTILPGVGLFQWQIVDSINMNLGGEYGFVAHCRTTANAVEVLLQYSANKMTDRDWSELHSCKLTSGRKSDFFQAMILGIQGDQVREIKERWPIFQSDPTKATLSQVVKSQVADALRVERGDLESVASAEAKAVAKVAAEAAAKAVVEAAAEALAEATAVATEGRVAPPLSPSGMDGGSGAPLLQEEEGGDDDGDDGDGDDGDGDDGDGDDGDGDGDDGDDENDDDDTTTEGEGDSVSRSSHDDEDRYGMLDGAGGIEGSRGATNSQPIHEKANKQKRKKRRKTKKKKKKSGSSGGSASSEAVAKANVASSVWSQLSPIKTK